MADTVLDLAAANEHMNGTPRSVAEQASSWSPEDKEEALILLLKELIEINGGEGLIPFRNLGYYVPPKAADELHREFRATLPPEVCADLDKLLPVDFNSSDVLSDEEVQAILRGEYAELK